MSLRVINLVDSRRQINFGVWNAAIATSPALRKLASIKSELWFPRETKTAIPPEFHTQIDGFEEVASNSSFRRLLQSRMQGDLPLVVVSHGAWRDPTRWAAHAKSRGIPWIYTPHGMLKPWCMDQKWIRKAIYFRFFEKPMLQKCDVIRAVSLPEHRVLETLLPYKDVATIPNGIEMPPMTRKRAGGVIRFVFLSRLHKVKAVTELVTAFCRSSLRNNPQFELIIAGPDAGEGPRIQQCIQRTTTNNVSVLGAVYDDEKFELLESSDFFVLPSYSEGFPTSVVEAMGRGCIPILSEGCSFPEAEPLTILASPDVDSIELALLKAAHLSSTARQEWSESAAKFVRNCYTVDQLAHRQIELLRRLTNMDLPICPAVEVSQVNAG
ncbi:putative teichuronic acid biosynthesis glycosyltransferase TuaC [Rubripirellula tenax]|uniref:Putative teichuronic acid biosynthesis glycosyltransferase TuaC n=1 Tax=Rubripirellula tenax TaxID=2528015 RepID=A0A5C6EHQ6_9BACT|nr:glycosyltransferase [Rubripirellula tenax]TWU47577.1 putative teichuronic acid biosynthesis glycosyltransferase TuaC [Rubripirellula tenax]